MVSLVNVYVCMLWVVDGLFKGFLPIPMPTTSQWKAKCKIRARRWPKNGVMLSDAMMCPFNHIFYRVWEKRAEAQHDVWRDDALNHYMRLWKASMEIFERNRDESTFYIAITFTAGSKKNVAGWPKSSQTLRKREVKVYLGHFCEFSCPINLECCTEKQRTWWNLCVKLLQ